MAVQSFERKHDIATALRYHVFIGDFEHDVNAPSTIDFGHSQNSHHSEQSESPFSKKQGRGIYNDRVQ